MKWLAIILLLALPTCCGDPVKKVLASPSMTAQVVHGYLVANPPSQDTTRALVSLVTQELTETRKDLARWKQRAQVRLYALMGLTVMVTATLVAILLLKLKIF